MKLVMTLLVKNEVDIIEDNIKFHLRRGVSHIIATDNGSTDGTREILAEYAKKGILTLIDEPHDDYSQWRWVTRMALLARERHDAEWVINNDADEFWWHPEKDLPQVLANTSAQILDCQRWNMVYPFPQNVGSNWRERVIYRSIAPKPIIKPHDLMSDPLEAPYFLCRLPSKALVRTKGLRTVAQGNHSADFDGEFTRETGSIVIFHFPVRSAAQFEAKIRQGGDAYARNTELPKSVGWHWRRWHKKLRTHGLEETLSEALPSPQEVVAGLRYGSMTVDRTVSEELTRLASE